MDLALVGVVLPQVENHSLSSLRAAVEAAGYEARVVPFGGFFDLEAAVSTVLRERPRLCGISIQSTESALSSLTLAAVLRARGYAGTIACGGHFATLNAEEILRAPVGVDVVVRFAGETALVGMLRLLDERFAVGGAADALLALPGVVLRAADGQPRVGAPARVVESSAPRWPVREGALPLHLGFPAADLVSSRGCEAHCSYCCVAGASELARRETERAGGDVARATHQRRSVSAIADEIAWLWHERGARVFNFMDDNLLPLDPQDAVAWARGLGGALAGRRVGRIAFSLQLRADVVSPSVADALVELGLVRAYVGIDALSVGQLRALGRVQAEGAGPSALGELARRGVFSVCNALFLGPTFRFETILDEIEALRAIRHAPLHLLPIDVRAGTAYARRAEERGLLEGGPLWRHYRYEDARTGLLAEVIAGLPTRLAERSVPIALYDLGYNLGIARRLVPSAATDEAAATWARVAERWNVDQWRVLEIAAAVAATGDRAAILRLRDREALAVRAHDEALLEECDRALAAVEDAVSRATRRPSPAHARGRLLSAMAFSMGLAACNRGALDAPMPDATLARPDQAVALDLTVPSPPMDQAAACPDGRTPMGTVFCLPCGGTPGAGNITMTVDKRGVVTAIHTGDGGLPPKDVLDCLMKYFQMYCYPSLAGQTVPVTTHCWVA